MLARFGHIAIAFFVLYSTTGLVVNKHFCQNELKSIAFFAKAKSCHQSTMPADCPMHGHSSEEGSKGCCDNESDLIQSDYDTVMPSGTDLVILDIPTTIQLPLRAKSMAHNKNLIISRSFLTFRPPPLSQRLATLQSFLC